MSDLEERLYASAQAARDAVARVHADRPPRLDPAPSPWRRTAVALGAAAVLLAIIGGSSLWVRHGDPAADGTTTDATAPPSTAAPATTVPSPGGADRLAALTERERALALDLRTVGSSLASSAPIDGAGLAMRYEDITFLAAEAESQQALDTLGTLQTELNAILRLETQVADELAQAETEHREVLALLAELALSPEMEVAANPDTIAAVEGTLDQAQRRVVAIRTMREELRRRIEQLESAMAAVYVTVAPPEGTEEITVTHHDYGLRDVPFGGTSFVALAADAADLWAVTSLAVADEGGTIRDAGWLFHIDAVTGEEVARVELPQPMSMIAPAAEVIWIARRGDGGLPDNLVGTVDRRTLAVDLTDVGDLSIAAIAPDGDSLWMASPEPGVLSRFDRSSGTIRESFDLDLGASAGVSDMMLMQEPDPVLWLSTWDGVVLRIDATTGAILGMSEVADGLADLSPTAAIDPTGASPVWAVGVDVATLLGSDGAVLATYPLDDPSCCATPGFGAGDGAWIAATSGELWFVYPGGVDLITTVPPPTDDANEGGGPRSITSHGLSVWLAQGPWLTQVRFPQ